MRQPACDKYSHIKALSLPYSYKENHISPRDSILMCQKAYANVPIFRNAVDIMAELANSPIYKALITGQVSLSSSSDSSSCSSSSPSSSSSSAPFSTSMTAALPLELPFFSVFCFLASSTSSCSREKEKSATAPYYCVGLSH